MKKSDPKEKKKPRTPARSAPTPRGVTRSAIEKKTASTSGDRYAHARSLIRDIPDFPRPGILFKDITPMLADPKGFHMVLDGLAEHFTGEHVDVIVGIESRGFIFGGALAARLNASFVPLRKIGKLPAETDRVSYELEYGTAELEIHVDSIESGAKVVIVDDLLATGGTAAAAGELVRRQGGYIAAYAFILELDALHGRDRLGPSPVISLIRYGLREARRGAREGFRQLALVGGGARLRSSGCRSLRPRGGPFRARGARVAPSG